LSWIDIALIAVIVFGGYRGYRQGFLMETFSLLGLILGVLGGFKLMGMALVFLSDRFDIDERILPYVAFAVVFILIVVGVNLLGKALRASIDKTLLGRIDEAAGAFLGAVKTVFMISVVLWIISSVKLDPNGLWAGESQLVPYVAAFAPLVTSWIGELIPAFNDIF
jgi:membrane protein required for colicin V production